MTNPKIVQIIPNPLPHLEDETYFMGLDEEGGVWLCIHGGVDGNDNHFFNPWVPANAETWEKWANHVNSIDGE